MSIMDLNAIIDTYSDVKEKAQKSEPVTVQDEQLFPEEIFELKNLNFVENEATAADNLEGAPATQDQELVQEMATIPDKMAFKIGEVADIVGVKQYVLRYWETEFEALKPKKSRQNQRMYARRDIENVMLIKKLLYRDKFSIEGARRALRSLKANVRETKQWDQVADRYSNAIELMKELVADIRNMKNKWR